MILQLLQCHVVHELSPREQSRRDWTVGVATRLRQLLEIRHFQTKKWYFQIGRDVFPVAVTSLVEKWSFQSRSDVLPLRRNFRWKDYIFKPDETYFCHDVTFGIKITFLNGKWRISAVAPQPVEKWVFQTGSDAFPVNSEEKLLSQKFYPLYRGGSISIIRC